MHTSNKNCSANSDVVNKRLMNNISSMDSQNISDDPQWVEKVYKKK